MTEFELEALKASVLFTFREDYQSGKMKYTELDACHAYKLLLKFDVGGLVDGVIRKKRLSVSKSCGAS